MRLTTFLRIIARAFGAGRGVQRRYQDRRPWEPDHTGALRRHQQMTWLRFGGAVVVWVVLALFGAPLGLLFGAAVAIWILWRFLQ